MAGSHTAAFYLAPAVKLVGSAYPSARPVIGTFAQAAKLGDFIYGGRFQINGTVKVAGTPDAPAHRRVRLYRDRDGRMVGETWSDPVTGAYKFSGIDGSQTYSAIAFDYTHNFRAVIADNLTPDPMP